MLISVNQFGSHLFIRPPRLKEVKEALEIKADCFPVGHSEAGGQCLKPMTAHKAKCSAVVLPSRLESQSHSKAQHVCCQWGHLKSFLLSK